MPKNIIGLDIGTDSIKAVQIKNTFKGSELVNFVIKETPKTDEGKINYDLLPETLEELFKQENLNADTVISSIGGHLAVIRDLTLPFKDIKKIQQVVKYEVESYIPFPLGEVVVNFYTTNSKKEKETDITAVIINKETIQKHLDLLHKANIEPQSICLDPLASFTAFSCSHPPKSDELISLIDIGMEKTSVCIVKEGKILFLRSIPRAGNAITKALEKEFKISWAEAEKGKKGEGSIVLEEEKNEDENRISQVIKTALEPLIKEIERSLTSFQANYKINNFSKIVLTGGTSKLKNIDKYFSKKLGIPTEILGYTTFIPTKLNRIDILENIPLISTGLGLALQEVQPQFKPKVDFRKEEFAFPKEKGKSKFRTIVMGIFIFLLFLASTLNIYYKLNIKEKKYAALKTEIRGIFKNSFPEVKNIVNELQQMKDKIKEANEKLDVFGQLAKNPVTPLQMIYDLSTNISEEIKIDILSLSINPDNMQIKGVIDSYNSVDKLKKKIEKFDYVKEVKINKAKVGADEKTVGFELNIQFKK